MYIIHSGQTKLYALSHLPLLSQSLLPSSKKVSIPLSHLRVDFALSPIETNQGHLHGHESKATHWSMKDSLAPTSLKKMTSSPPPAALHNL